MAEDKTIEEWRDIPGYEGYQVSNLGRIKSLNYGNSSKEKILKTELRNDGYCRIDLYKNKKRKHFSIHRLVYETFVGPIPEGMQVNHIDENPQNNHLDNLNLLTPKENSNWGTRNERVGIDCLRNRKWVLQFDLDGEFVAIYKSTKEAETITHINNGNISSCCTGRMHTAGGYVWRYIKDPEV